MFARALVWTVVAAGCATDYDITVSTGTGAYGSMGVIYEVKVSGDSDLDGVALTMTALPSSITISPPAVTLDSDGTGAAYALVPYGVSGVVLASGAFATTASAEIAAPPLTLCAPSFTPTMQSNATARVYTASVKVVRSGDCMSGEVAPPGVPITLAVAGTSSVLNTDANGMVALNISVPWGSTVFVLASGGGGSTSGSVTGESNPAPLSYIQWTKLQELYRVEATVLSKTAELPSVPVAFSIVARPAWSASCPRQ